jgi:hypothetical protein
VRRLPIVFALALAALPARAADDPANAPDAGKVWASCVERLPDGASRPKLTEVFPDRGTSGWAAPLEITVVHGKGETVMPSSMAASRSSDAYKALEEAGFVLPDPDGGAGPQVKVEPGEAQSTTKLTVPFVPLPKNPGRSVMMLPPVPVTIARASGELITVCTTPHPILVEDPIVNELDPKVRPNPPGRPQREEWEAAKKVAIGVLVGVILTAIGAWLLSRWAKRPKPEIVVPKKLPWIEALEELEAVRTSSLIAEGKTDVYFDRVSDCVRKYLGARYGFDGLESTTHEMEKTLARVRPPVRGLDTISRFLEECDLVKFARVVPTENDCLASLERGITIVKNTTPLAGTPSAASAQKPGTEADA